MNEMAIGTGEEAKVDPCLWVTDVSEGSPAEAAGLLLGDAVLKIANFTPTK